MGACSTSSSVQVECDWVNVKDRLPAESGWYLVYAPEYYGSKHKEFHDGYGFAKFTIPKKGEAWWSIDDHHSDEYVEIELRWRKNYLGEHNPAVQTRKYVKLWMPLKPVPGGFT